MTRPDESGISIAMATYNGAAHLPEQLASLAAQSHAPRELVVTDDGSRDDTARIIEAFGRTASFPVRFFRNAERLGYADNFLRAATLCTSPIIAFCDQDDAWQPDKLRVCATAFAKPEIVLCVHAAIIWHGGDDLGPVQPHFASRQCFAPFARDPLTSHPGHAMLFRRNLLDIAGLARRPVDFIAPGGRARLMAHDHFIWFLASVFGEIVTVPDVLVRYRQHGLNMFGAAAARGWGGKCLDRARMTGYADEAARMHEYARFFQGLQQDLAGAQSDRARQAALRLRARAGFLEDRHDIYGLGKNLPERAAGFLRILRRGGYMKDGFNTSPGGRAAVKDLLFGLPGLHRLFRAGTQPGGLEAGEENI